MPCIAHMQTIMLHAGGASEYDCIAGMATYSQTFIRREAVREEGTVLVLHLRQSTNMHTYTHAFTHRATKTATDKSQEEVSHQIKENKINTCDTLPHWETYF